MCFLLNNFKWSLKRFNRNFLKSLVYLIFVTVSLIKIIFCPGCYIIYVRKKGILVFKNFFNFFKKNKIIIMTLISIKKIILINFNSY